METYEQRWERRNRKLQERISLIPAQLASDIHILPERPSAPAGVQTVVDDRIIIQSRRAAKSALIMWYSGQWQRQAESIDDLINDLVEWYINRPSTQTLVGELSDPQVMVTFRNHAFQLLAKAALDNDVFEGKALYSVDAVKDALRGESSNKYLNAVLPIAIKRLNESYQEALAKRYTDGEFPQNKRQEDAQRRATNALVREINVLYITADVDGVGSSSVVFPETIRPKGDYSDPTANIALTLMGQHPDLADEYLYESPWDQVCYGAETEPVIEFGPSGRYRLTAEEAKLFRRVPGLIELFIEQKQKEWADA